MFELMVVGTRVSSFYHDLGFVLPVVLFVGVVYGVAKAAPYDDLLESVKSRWVRDRIVWLLKFMQRGGASGIMAANPYLDRDEFDFLFERYLVDKNHYEAILWRFAWNRATPVEILSRLPGNLETRPEVAVRELLITHPAVSDEVKTMWALQWGLKPQV